MPKKAMLGISYLVILVLGFGLLIPVYAFADDHNVPPVTISLDSNIIANGGIVTVSGNIKNYDSSSLTAGKITYLVISPDNDIVAIGQLIPNSDGSYEFAVTAGGNLWKLSGDYTIQVRYGSDTSEITVDYVGGEFVGSEPPPPPPVDSEPPPVDSEPPSPPPVDEEPTCGAGTELVNGICQVIRDEEPEPTHDPEPEELEIPAPFVDETKDPQFYVDRYNNEPEYKEWFDSNFPEYSSIYQAVGLPEPIPEWVRGVFVFWANGNITDEELKNAIKFLVNSGIIVLDEK